jgi:hypothetical protein
MAITCSAWLSMWASLSVVERLPEDDLVDAGTVEPPDTCLLIVVAVMLKLVEEVSDADSEAGDGSCGTLVHRSQASEDG